MGIEALSRGADRAVFVDQDKFAIQCIRSNLKALDLEKQARVVTGDVMTLISTLGTYDLIYVDPPYTEKGAQTCYSREVLLVVDRSELLAADGILFIEDSRTWEPKVKDLKTLYLKSSRKVGCSMLHQFCKQ